jgi:hypothetical protein
VTDRPPTSVLLPTTAWTDACGEVAAQLAPEDELLIVHDTAADPVADRETLPDGVELVRAGEPAGCSGKANAIAAGMRAASHDRIVWTDDDFPHPPGWLDQLLADYERQGPTTELPVFVGQDPLAVLLEPVYMLGGTLGTYLGDHAWGGAVVFDRSDLDVEAFLDELTRTISDDGHLGEHLDVSAVRRTHEVPIGGDTRTTLERHVRFTKIAASYDTAGIAVGSLLLVPLAAGTLLYPLFAALVTLTTLAVYAAFGVRRPSALLGVPALLCSPVLTVYAFARRTFVWGGRRYRWHDTLDVEIVDSDS